MDLNHARLPIPPRWQVDFSRSGRNAAASGRPAYLFYRHEGYCQTADRGLDRACPSRPIFLAGQNRNNFKVDDVVPAPHPRHQRLVIRGLHNLIADAAVGNEPARLIDNIVRQHPSMLLVSLAHELSISGPLNNHKKHMQSEGAISSKWSGYPLLASTARSGDSAPGRFVKI